jgi:hypothetical protein
MPRMRDEPAPDQSAPPNPDAAGRPADGETRGATRSTDPSPAFEFDRVAPAITFAIALLVYVKTLLPGIAFGDWGEMQTVAHVLGVPHPTGYPTYVLVAWLFELLPLGSVAVRANLLSAFLVAGALAALTATAQRLAVRPAIAIGAALATGAIGTIWAAATVAEVNPLHLFLIALLIHRAAVWEDRRFPRDLVIGGLLIGLALGNHLLTLFVLPFVGLYVLWAGRREFLARPLIAIPGIAAGAAALLVYLYLPLAANSTTPLQYNHPTTFDGVYWLVTGVQFRGQFDFLSSKGPGEFLASLPALWDLAVDRASWILPVMAAVGTAFLLRRRMAFGLVALGLVTMGAYLWANYLRLEHYLLVPFLVLGILAAAGFESLARAVARWLPDLRVAGPSVAAASLVFAGGLGAMNWQASDRSGNEAGREYVTAMDTTLAENAAVISGWDFSTPLWYASHVEGLRPDILVVDDSNIVYDGWGSRENAVAQLICKRPVYAIRYDDNSELRVMRQLYDVSPVMKVFVGWGGPTAAGWKSVYLIAPRANTCGG